MRVLLTGVTRPQIGRMGRSRTNLCSNPGLLKRAVERAGHHVDWRPVVPGENLGGYDAIIVGLSNMFSFGAQWRFGALWALGHSGSAILVDDWNIWGVTHTLHGIAKGGAGALFRWKTVDPDTSILPTDSMEEGWRHASKLLGVVDELAAGNWRWPVLGSFFEWGDTRIFSQEAPEIRRLWTFDPSVYQPTFPGKPDPGSKYGNWVIAALPDHNKWIRSLGLTWPVTGYGKKYGGEYVHESEVYQEYLRSWGVLSPPYKHAGSGWWRNRFKYAADAGALLLCDPREVQGLGPEYTFTMGSRCSIEKMDWDELRDLANQQKSALYSHMWSEERFVTFAEWVVRQLVAEA